MAASMTRAAFSMTLSFSRQTARVNHVCRLLSTDVHSSQPNDLKSEDDGGELEESRINMLRDISGLTEPQKRRFRGQVPEMDTDYKRSVRFHRLLYGKLGSASGVDPRLSWPGKQEALELAELTREWEPPLEDRLAKLQMEKEETAQKTALRQKKIADSMAKMDQWVAEYRQKLRKKAEEVEKKQEKKQQLLEEARDYFGYYVQPSNPKFQEMLEEKELREKELAKKQRKEKRMQRLAAQIQAMARQDKPQ